MRKRHGRTCPVLLPDMDEQRYQKGIQNFRLGNETQPEFALMLSCLGRHSHVQVINRHLEMFWISQSLRLETGALPTRAKQTLLKPIQKFLAQWQVWKNCFPPPPQKNIHNRQVGCCEGAEYNHFRETNAVSTIVKEKLCPCNRNNWVLQTTIQTLVACIFCSLQGIDTKSNNISNNRSRKHTSWSLLYTCYSRGTLYVCHL